MLVHLFTPVWKVDYYNLWSETRQSLFWPKNMKALEACDVVWKVHTDGTYIPSLPFKSELVRHGGISLRGTINLALKQAVAEDAILLFAPPDMIFGDGTVGNLLRLASLGKNMCIAAPHVRITRPIDLSQTLSNADLVKVAFKNLHRSFVDARYPASQTNTYKSGVAWTDLGDGLYAGTFFLPTIHAVKPTKQDVDWFETEMHPGAWDHLWPSRLAGRYKVIGSSDAAFMAEYTTGHPSVPEKVKDDVWDAYQGSLPHHASNRTVSFIFRCSQ